MLEKYTFTGSPTARFHQEVFVSHAASEGLHLPQEIPHSPEREEQISALEAELVSFVRNEFDLDVSGRLISHDRIRFFQPSEWGRVRKRYGMPFWEKGFFTGEGIVVGEQPQSLNVLGHQLVHHVSSMTVQLRREDNQPRAISYRTGYKNGKNQSLAVIEEALTEITNQEVLERARKNPVLMKIPTSLAHKHHVILFDELVKQIAADKGKGYQAVLRELQRGKITGDMSVLRTITEVIGKERMKYLAKFHPGNRDGVSRVAAALGLNGAVLKLQDYNRGRSVPVLENVLEAPLLVSIAT